MPAPNTLGQAKAGPTGTCRNPPHFCPGQSAAKALHVRPDQWPPDLPTPGS